VLCVGNDKTPASIFSSSVILETSVVVEVEDAIVSGGL
jgi:hypothetical protein